MAPGRGSEAFEEVCGLFGFVGDIFNMLVVCELWVKYDTKNFRMGFIGDIDIVYFDGDIGPLLLVFRRIRSKKGGSTFIDRKNKVFGGKIIGESR